jgi:hypothetical protein
MKKLVTQELKDLKRQMTDKFNLSFGHRLSSEEHEANYNEYLKLRDEYLGLFKKLNGGAI